MKLSDIIRNISRLFEKKRKNPIQLGVDSNLESNLKPLKVSSENTPIHISETEVNIDGSLKVNGASVQTGTDAGATELNELSDVTYDGDDLEITGLDKLITSGLIIENSSNFEIDSNGDIILDANGGCVDFKDNESAKMTIDFSNASSNLALESASALNFEIDSGGDIILDSHNGCIEVTKAATSFGEINLDTASTLKLVSTTNYHINLESTGTGDIVLDSNGDITLDSADGNFIASKAGTEFSAANSSYAGMILGYSVFRNLTANSGNEAISISTTMTVLATAQGNALNISFVAPPSGKVEIVLSCLVYASSKSVYFSLSDNATYNELNVIHTYDWAAIKPDESDYVSAYIPFVVEGLTAGTSYQYWIAAKVSSSTGFISHGVERTDNKYSQPIAIKATALPATIVNAE